LIFYWIPIVLIDNELELRRVLLDYDESEDIRANEEESVKNSFLKVIRIVSWM